MQFLGRRNRKAEQILGESRVPRLRSQDIGLLYTIWLELNDDITPEEIDYHDVAELL
jgi:hypothetical protein